jgi:hypothetical protein
MGSVFSSLRAGIIIENDGYDFVCMLIFTHRGIRNRKRKPRNQNRLRIIRFEISKRAYLDL